MALLMLAMVPQTLGMELLTPGMVPQTLGMALLAVGMIALALGMTVLAVGMTPPSLGIILALTTPPPPPAITPWQDSGDLLLSSCPRSREQFTRSWLARLLPLLLTPSSSPPWLLTSLPISLLFLFFSKKLFSEC